MRGKRAKKYKKLMSVYEKNFGFREPYQVLFDSQILQDAWQQKIDIQSRLKKVLGGEVKGMISQCDIRHLYSAKPKDEALIQAVKEDTERRRCGHHELEHPLSSLECITECVDPKSTSTNKHRYVVATNDPKLRVKLRGIPGVPLVFLSKSILILEPMAEVTENARQIEEKQKFRVGLRRGVGQKRKRDDEEGHTQPHGTQSIVGQSDGGERPQKKKAKGPKGPNPLSVKKSKKQPPLDSNDEHAAKLEPARPEVPQLPVEDDGESPANDEVEQQKRKRKRKHKPKGEGGLVAQTEGDTAVS